MSTQTFNLSLPKTLVKKIDDQAKQEFSSRSDYVRRAVLNQLKSDQALNAIFERANKKGKSLGFESEQSVYDEIASEN